MRRLHPGPSVSTPPSLRSAGNTTVLYRRAPQRPGPGAEAMDPALDGTVPLNFPRRVQTVRFTPPAHQPAIPPAASLPGPNVLSGKPLRYLIGGAPGRATTTR